MAACAAVASIEAGAARSVLVVGTAPERGYAMLFVAP
jgi:hypothetical protein